MQNDHTRGANLHLLANGVALDGVGTSGLGLGGLGILLLFAEGSGEGVGLAYKYNVVLETRNDWFKINAHKLVYCHINNQVGL